MDAINSEFEKFDFTKNSLNDPSTLADSQQQNVRGASDQIGSNSTLQWSLRIRIPKERANLFIF
jgi:hypothetical protein